MKVEFRQAVEKIRTFGRRLVFRASIGPDQLVSPPLTSSDTEISATIQSNGSEPGISVPTVDYRGIALGYFGDILKRNRMQGRSSDEVLASLYFDSVLKGVKGVQIKQALEAGTYSLEVAKALAELIPANPRRDARRALVLWEEQVSRGHERITPTNGTRKANGNKENGKHKLSEATPAEQEANNPDIETERVKNYTMGRLYQKPIDPKKGLRFGVEEMTEEEVTELIRERANKLARGDERLVTDFTTIIDLLRKNPTPNGNEGVKRMEDKRIAIESIPHPLWRFSPKRSKGLSLSHPESESMRVVYAIYKNNGTKLIVLDGDGIYTHRQFDRKYSGGKSSRKK